ncbi:MAG: class I SAM-dependent methyltransferase [Deltaproteobacteria bacterium]|nr:class I SAM-dependent methyltransferase [Deltaproteobacteria bacterium]
MSNLDWFIDPKTKKALSYNQESASVDTADGKISYPVINGVPRFVSPELYKEAHEVSTDEVRTGRSFGDKWRESRYEFLGSEEADRAALEEHFIAILGCTSAKELHELLNGATSTLNGGCGVAWNEYLFNINLNAQRHCVDLSLSVETARTLTKDLDNITVSQASVLELPYPDETFDIAYSCGVVHHTPDPKGAVLEIGRTVKAGGLLGIYIYNIKPFIRELSDKEIRKKTTTMSYDECMDFSKKMTMLGKAFKDINAKITIEEDIDLIGMKKGEYDLQKFVYDHFIKCWYNPKQDDKYADLVNQDWYHPHYASHHTKEEVFAWFEEAGFSKIKCLQPSGWEHSGYYISGKKCK